MFQNQRQVCQNYVTGICLRGASCPYLHISSDSENKESGKDPEIGTSDISIATVETPD
jgi:hypothetical protein